MGNIRARADNGKLLFDFQYERFRCREYTTLDNTVENRAKLQLVLAEIESAIKRGKFVYEDFFPSSKNVQRFKKQSREVAVPEAPGPLPLIAPAPALLTPSFKEFSATWFQQMSVQWRQSTREAYRSLLDVYLLPEFGDKSLSEITRDDVLTARAKFAAHRFRSGKQRSAKSVNEAMGIFATIMAEASMRFPIKNPAARIKRLKVQRVDIFPFKLDEVQKLLRTVRADYRNYLTVRFFAGLRTGEVDGLKWHYVDFDARQILIRETFTKGRVEYTKTDGSQREVIMSTPVYEALKAQEKLTKGRGEFVFCLRDGQPLIAKNFANRVWYPLLRHLNLRKRRPYQTRHTCATLWLAAGENPEWIARQLGHATTEMLFRVYSRFIPNLTRKDGSAIEQLLANNALAGNPTGEGAMANSPSNSNATRASS
jgi:integrase